VGHRSTIIGHLGNISFKTGKKLHWDADNEDSVDAPDASRFLARVPRQGWNLV
jgi:hypothetical protein